MFSRYFLYTDARRTELLQGMPTNANNGGPDPVAWAFNRADGGRSFVWGGSDFHDNMHNVADYRRFLLNAITWIAGLDVPQGGVAAPPPPTDDPPIPAAPGLELVLAVAQHRDVERRRAIPDTAGESSHFKPKASPPREGRWVGRSSRLKSMTQSVSSPSRPAGPDYW